MKRRNEPCNENDISGKPSGLVQDFFLLFTNKQFFLPLSPLKQNLFFMFFPQASLFILS